MKDPLVTMETGNGCVKIELYPDTAPNTVRNFISLARRGFYDGTIFHRIIPNFMIQGGDPKGTGTGGSGVTIKGEFSANGVKNTLSHSRGVISMARSDPFNSASSQFFIMHADDTGLDGKYAAFGKVLEGMDVVDRIAAVKVNKNNKPLTEQRMKRVTLLNNYTAGESSENTSQEQSENDSSVTDTSD